MKFFASLLKGKKGGKSSFGKIDQKQEALVKQGREQFKALIKKGLGVPVALL